MFQPFNVSPNSPVIQSFNGRARIGRARPLALRTSLNCLMCDIQACLNINAFCRIYKHNYFNSTGKKRMTYFKNKATYISIMIAST